MIFATPDPVPSGRDFDVIAVNGRTPHAIVDFVGGAVFTVQWSDQERLIAGEGHTDRDGVRFIEKDVNHGGKDVRAWFISSADQPGRFTARTGA